MESWLTWIFLVRASQSASRRADQCVTPIAASAPGGGVTVADRISAITSSVSTLRGPPGRGASASPASPAAAYWARHLTTVGSLQPTRSAISRPGQPVRRQQHDPGPLGHPPGGAAVPGHPLQLHPVSIGDRDNAHAIRHAALSRNLIES